MRDQSQPSNTSTICNPDIVRGYQDVIVTHDDESEAVITRERLYAVQANGAVWRGEVQKVGPSFSSPSWTQVNMVPAAATFIGRYPRPKALPR